MIKNAMDKELENKFATLADDMLKSFSEMSDENLEDVLDFNEDEQYLFDMIYNAKSLLDEASGNYDSLDLRDEFKKVYPKKQLVQILGLLEKALLKG